MHPSHSNHEKYGADRRVGHATAPGPGIPNPSPAPAAPPNVWSVPGDGRLSGMTQKGLFATVNDSDNIRECRVPPLGSPDRGACHVSSGESGWSCSG